MEQNFSVKVRAYPNEQQKKLIHKTTGCVRFVYNKVLDFRQTMYESEAVRMSAYDCNNYCNRELKQEYPWLREVDKFSLSNSIHNMDRAYQNFFKNPDHFRFPKFKKKYNSRQSYTTTFSRGNIQVDYDNNRIKLPKLKWIKVKGLRKFTGRIYNATVSYYSSEKYYISLCVLNDIQPLEQNDSKIGIDLGIKEFITTSDGIKIDNLKFIKKYDPQIKWLQKELSRKVKGSKSYKDTKKRLAKKYEKLRNERLDFLHKVSHDLIINNQVIVSEKLNVRGMMQNHRLAKSIGDVSWYELTRQLDYKSKWYGRSYVQIDTFFPSSQLCSNCNYRNEKIKNLNIREWTCPNCNTHHDRDINAAKNILNVGVGRAFIKPVELETFSNGEAGNPLLLDNE